MKYIINGKFYSQNITGVQRFAREIIMELDNLVDDNCEIEVAICKDCINIPLLKKIKTVIIGPFKGGVMWEQFNLPLYVRSQNAVCINLCNSMPIFSKNITVLHDVSFKVNPQFYARKINLWTNFVVLSCIYRLRKIITVSNFSKSEIISNYQINENQIEVIYNGWQHYKRIEYAENCLKKYGLEKGNFYFAMSSLTKNKNFKWIAENAKKNPNITYAVSGSINKRVFSDAFDFEVPSNMKFLGYVSDEEAKTLMRDCKAFLFPTFYEGFGIPPLEALSVGAKIVVSDASCMREIYGETAYYIDPYNPNVDLDELLKETVADPSEALGKYSWKKSAEKLYQLLFDTENGVTEKRRKHFK